MLRILEKKIELNATLNYFDQFMSFVNDELVSLQINDGDRIKILTSCEEIIVNIINYAYCRKEGPLEILFQNDSTNIKITFKDKGIAFNPLSKADADTSLPLEERQIGGLGILMVKNLMDEISYEYKNQQNCLTIVKHTSNITNTEDK